MDLSKVSTEDLKAFQAGDLSKVSTEGLRALQGATPDPRAAKIDKHLDETDTLLGLPPGTSARQIHQESRFKDDAVSPVGARGLAQVMPATLASLSKRMGRQLDPHNTDDALLMHREVMRENMARFGNVKDALQAYNAGWDKTKWANPETEGYLKKILVDEPPGFEAARETPMPAFSKVRKDVDPAKLKDDKDWLEASRRIYGLRERRAFEGSDEDLAEWGKDFMGYFNFNLFQMSRYAADLAKNGTEDEKRAFLFLMDTYDNTDFTWEGAGRAAKGIFSDPVNLASAGGLLVGVTGKVLAHAAAREGIRQTLLTALGRTGIVAGVEGAVIGAADSTIRQGVEVTAGRREGIDGLTVLGKAAIGAGAGLAIGTVGDSLVQAVAPATARGLSNLKEVLAGRVPGKALPEAVAPPVAPSGGNPSQTAQIVAPGAPGARLDPVVVPSGATTVASGATPLPAPPLVGPLPRLTPERVLNEMEIAIAATRRQKGRSWEDDLPPVVPADKAATDALVIPPSGEGLRSTPRSNVGTEQRASLYADQLRAMDDKTLASVMEGVRHQELSLEDHATTMAGISFYRKEMTDDLANAIKRLGLSENAQETVALTRQIGNLENRMIPLQLADEALGSIAGSILQQRKINPFAGMGVTRESLMAEHGLTADEARVVWAKLAEGIVNEDATKKLAAQYDVQGAAALAAGDHAAASRIAAEKASELNGMVDRVLPGNASFWAKVKEAVISNIFTVKTVAINLFPAAAKTLMLPLVRATVNDPLRAATRHELVGAYSAMITTFGASVRAARASFKYEQSLLTRSTGRIMEGELAIQGRKGGIIRFFPRVLAATDELLGQMNYNAFIGGRHAAISRATREAEGLTGKALDDAVKLDVKIELEKAYIQDDMDALIQPLVNKGVNLKLTGPELWAYVRREAVKDPRARRHGSNEAAIDYVNDVLYKRNPSGKGAVSGGAKAFLKWSNKHPGFALLSGQLFLRTPLRVFEEGVRFTPGLQILAPNFLADLAGKNGTTRQTRAQAESLASIAIAGAALTLYSQGRITGGGSDDNWKQGRTNSDGAGMPLNSLKMDDGSTWTFRNFDPIAFPLKVIVGGMERMDKLTMRMAQGEDIPEAAWQQAWAYVSVGTMAIGSAIRDANLTAGVDGMVKLMEAWENPEDKSAQLLKLMGDRLSWAVPNTFHGMAKMNDPTLKDPADFWQVVETRLATLWVDTLVGGKTSYSYDVLGNVRRIVDTGTMWNIFSTASVEEREKGMSPVEVEVMAELSQLQHETGATFFPPTKHASMGSFDLRTVMTKDGTETLYDRWQRNYRALNPATLLHPIVTAPLPTGTRKYKAIKLEATQALVSELREAAFMKTMAEEPQVYEQFIEQATRKGQGKAGLFDFSLRTK